MSYASGNNPQIDYPRLLIGDTNPDQEVFSDSEILAAYNICSMGAWQSSMAFSGSMGRVSLPATPVSYLRVAALLLDILAGNRAKLAITKILDGNFDFAAAARELRAQAAAWREIDDDSGAFAVIEQVFNQAGFLQRYYSQVQRQMAL